MESPFKNRVQTVTAFDGYGTVHDDYNNNRSRTAGIDRSGNSDLNPVPLRAVPLLMHAREDIPKALIIESLIQLLSKKYEPDPRKSRRLFKVMCEFLHKNQLLDQSLLFCELKPTRRQFALNFDRLFTSIRDSIPNDNLSQELLFSVDSWLQNIQDGSGEGPIYVHNSQYLAEFEEECCIGKGGFGIVCKAKKKVDQHDYAVKKIPFDHSNDPLFKKIQLEVQLFAKLSHPNIVSYKTAWIEDKGAEVILNLIGSNEDSLSPEESEYKRYDKYENTVSLSNGSEMDVVHTTETLEEFEFMETEDEGQVSTTVKQTFHGEMNITSRKTLQRSLSMQQSDVNRTNESNHVCFTPITPSIRKKSLSDPTGDACRAVCAVVSESPAKNMKSVLFIQMELCQENLRSWLDKRVELHVHDTSLLESINEMEVMTIFKQILGGVSYLHEKTLVHRDLKPQNIMFDQNRIAKIGDFGLATMCCNGKHELHKPWIVATGLTSGVGTSPYAAPEQRDKSDYDSKADMYSLGVILFELLVPFSTQMERAKVLGDLENGIIAQNICDRFPRQVDIILQLVNKNPSLRPSADEILRSSFFMSKDQIIKELTKENADLKKQIKEYERLLGVL